MASLALAVLAGAPARSAKVAGWEIVSSPGIARCAMDMQFPGGTIILMYYDARVQMYFFALTNEDWTFLHDGDPGTTLKVLFSGRDHAHNFRSDIHAHRYFFKADPEFVTDFRDGLTMTITTAARTMIFPLKGTRAALFAAVACADKKLATDMSDPFAKPQPGILPQTP